LRRSFGRGGIMSENRKRRLGDRGERAARAFLEQQGYRILETNHRTPAGEIDIVAREGDWLVFVEVRTRRGDAFGTPEESITPAKQTKLIELAQSYLQTHESVPELWRIDVVAIEIGRKGNITRIALIRNVTA